MVCLGLGAQVDSLRPKKPDYFKKEEIIHNNKRYAIHNNYLTFGAGFLSSNYHSASQKIIGIDYQFHIREQHFQAGALMSGVEFLSDNNKQLHLGYGYRKETGAYNLAFFAGPSYIYGVRTISDSNGIRPEIYENFGLYCSLQAVAKLTYDLGIGTELFAEISNGQKMFGFKLIAFFSGAYRGVKRNFNPNVRSQNPR
jgi:hypothetical protein